jgi:tetratricopeptide (TPR) repeat protein
VLEGKAGTVFEPYLSMLSHSFARSLALAATAGLLLAYSLSANAVETAKDRCEQAANLDAAIEACSLIIKSDNDRHRLALAYFNRAGWHLKKDHLDRAVADFNEAVRFEPDFAAALTKRGLVEERLNDLRGARADFAAVLKLPTTNNLSAWAHAMARERLAATEAAAKTAATSNPVVAANPVAAVPGRGSALAGSEFWRRPLAQVLQECNAKPTNVAIKLPGAKGAIELNRCYRGREHMSCEVAALLAEANSIKQDYAEIVSADYPNLKTLDSICQITPDRLTEHAKALQNFRERWSLLRKQYAARLECTNSVEDSLRNLSLADMSYGADLVKSMVESLRNELAEVSQAEKEVLNLDDQMEAAEKAIEKISQIRSGVCR